MSKKVQIISAPRMGSTALFLILLEGFNIDIREELRYPSEFMNRYIYPDLDVFRYEVKRKLDIASNTEDIVLKTHINHIHALESIDHLDHFKSRTANFKNIVLLRRDVKEQILSEVIAKQSGVWNNRIETYDPVTVNETNVRAIVQQTATNYRHIIDNDFDLNYHAIVYFEDLADPEYFNKAITDIFEPLFGVNFDHAKCKSKFMKPLPKAEQILNYNSVIEWVEDEMSKIGLADTMDMSQKSKFARLKTSEHFCAAPWTHLHVRPTGNVQPCCIWDYNVYRQDRERFGLIHDSTDISEVMNHDSFKTLRKKFLNNEYEEGCSRCYDREQTSTDDNNQSMRQWMNDAFLDKDMIDNTADDGHISNIQLKYLDIRFGNICNLKCRMCGHGLSSTWFEEEVDIAKIEDHYAPKEKFIHVDCYDMVEPYLQYVEEIYFAGGEPILYPEHVKLLDKLIELGRTNVKLKYNTNLTSLKYKGRDIVELWKQFNHVHIGASIDAMGDTVEYIRTKLSWKKFKENFERVRAEAPHVLLTPSPTIGLLNIETFDEFERFAITNGWYDTRPFGLNYVMQPEWLNIYNMPDWYKQEMIAKYRKHIDWCKEHGSDGFAISKIEELIVRLQHNTDPAVVDEYMEVLESKLDMWDETSGSLNWKSQLPHIKRLIDIHKQGK